MTPESRKDQLLAQDVGQELVVYDQQTHVAHRLNRTAALVWRLADGKRSVTDIASIVHDAVDLDDDQDSEELVRVALSELDGSGLLVRGATRLDEPISRRRMLIMTAALIPVVTSIAVPDANAMTTGTGTPAPLVFGVTPNFGPLVGGTAVTIEGRNLSGATAVSIGIGKGAIVDFSINEAGTSITGTTTPGTTGGSISSYGVFVTTPSGTNRNDYDVFFVYLPVPIINSVSPSSGPVAGGTFITINGIRLDGHIQNGDGTYGEDSTVTIGGASVGSVTSDWASPDIITGVAPPGTVGAQDVVVTHAGGSGTLVGGFTYFPLPTLASISPTSGAPAGGTAVTLSGTNLTGATAVTIGGVAATNLVVVNATTVTATAPAGTAGAQDVVVTTPGGTATLSGAFTYVSFTQQFDYTGAIQSLIVPAGVTSLVVDAFGAQGGYPLVGVVTDGAKGGRVVTRIAVTPAEVLTIVVGQQGQQIAPPAFGGGGTSAAGSGTGGGGGGYSAVIRSATILALAGAGGGGGAGANGPGGPGGGLIGGTAPANSVTGAGGGAGGTQAAGGAGGAASTSPGFAGGAAGTPGLSGLFPVSGGDGAPAGLPNPLSDGGGGGGGYFGGGGGGSAVGGASGGGGGGGGSSFATGEDIVHTQGVRDGNGVIIVTQGPDSG